MWQSKDSKRASGLWRQNWNACPLAGPCPLCLPAHPAFPLPKPGQLCFLSAPGYSPHHAFQHRPLPLTPATHPTPGSDRQRAGVGRAGGPSTSLPPPPHPAISSRAGLERQVTGCLARLQAPAQPASRLPGLTLPPWAQTSGQPRRRAAAGCPSPVPCIHRAVCA